MIRMLTPDELALWADESSTKHSPKTLSPEERLLLMLQLIERYHYHIIAPDIREACHRKAGVPSAGCY